MKHIFYLTILIIIYDEYNCVATNIKNKEFVYKFKNTITATNKASDKVLSQWTYSGHLIVQEYQKHKIFKLDNVKTSVFNGVKNNETDAIETNISDDKIILTEPFIVYVNSLTDVNITVLPNEEVWSINMKKSIASSFLIDTSINDDKTEIEQLIFGKCKIDLQVSKSRSTKIIEKTIDHNDCVEKPIKQWSNVAWMSTKNNHTSFQHETKRIYVVSKNNCLFSIDSSSNFTVQPSPDVKSTNRIEQNQYFELITSSENTKPFDVKNNTEIKNIIYEIPLFEPHKELNQKTYLGNFVNAYTKLKSLMKQRPLENWDVNSLSSPVSEMLKNLKKFDANCLQMLLVGVLMDKDKQYYQMFLEILPYAGTKHTVHLIKDIVNDDVALHNKIKLLAIFPEYVNEVNEEILKDFEEFLSFKSDIVQLKHSAILSFASLLGKGIDKNTIDHKIAEKYVKKLYEEYLNMQKHEDKMIYLLGLVNVSHRLPINAILNIIYNQKESRHIRALAMYGFKNRLTKFGKEMFTKFWPLVKNTNEHFQIRIAALDLLLSCEISENQFNEIVDFCDQELNNPYEEHLANYIVTTIISLQNNTGFQHYLGNWATEKFENRTFNQNLRVWTTGNYRIGFTDENSNFGAAFQARFIADPLTNAINVAQFAFDQFAMSMKLGEYHLYVKLEGVFDMIFIKRLLNARTDDTPIFDLINLIQQCKYQLKDSDELFVDFVLFSDNRALFAMHMDQDNIDKYIQSSMFNTLMIHAQNYKSISYPILNQIKIPSDLGTEIEISFDMQQVSYHELNNFLDLFKSDSTTNITINNKVFTHMTETVKSVNPLADLNINVEKLHHDLKILELPISIDTTDYSVSWDNQIDTFNWVMDNTIYTFVNNDTMLKEYCIECKQVEEIPSGEAAGECIEAEKHLNQCKLDRSIWGQKLFTYKPLGMNMNLTVTKESEEMENLRKMKKFGVNQLTEIVNTHQGNTLVFPLAKPFLYYLHLILYNRYLDNDLFKISVRSLTAFDKPYTSKLKFTPNEIQNDSAYGLIELSYKRNEDNHILSGIRATLNLTSSSQTQSQIGDHFELIADVLENENFKKKFCLNYTIDYPKKKSDKLSLSPIKPAHGTTTFSWDTVKSFEDKCPHYFIKLTEVLSVTEEYNQIVRNMKHYEKCKNESSRFKFIPPTKSCLAAHKAVSLYRDYVLYAELFHAGMSEDNDNKNNIFEYHHIDDKNINVSISKGLAKLFEMNPKAELLNFIEPSTFVDVFFADSAAVTYDDFDVNVGFSSMCVISPNNLIKYSGEHKLIFEETPPKDIIAFVECVNITQSGLTVHKVDKYTIVFKYWFGNNILLTKIQNGQLRVMLNRNEISENIDNDDLKLYFLENNIFSAKTDLLEIYYTTESIVIKHASLFNKYICGECVN